MTAPTPAEMAEAIRDAVDFYDCEGDGDPAILGRLRAAADFIEHAETRVTALTHDITAILDEHKGHLYGCDAVHEIRERIAAESEPAAVQARKEG